MGDDLINELREVATIQITSINIANMLITTCKTMDKVNEVLNEVDDLLQKQIVVDNGKKGVKTDLIKQIIRDRGFTYKDCAELLNLSLSQFQKKMNGKQKFYLEECEKLGNFLEMSNTQKGFCFLH